MAKLTVKEQIRALELILEGGGGWVDPDASKDYVLEKLRAIREGKFSIHPILVKVVKQEAIDLKNNYKLRVC